MAEDQETPGASESQGPPTPAKLPTESPVESQPTSSPEAVDKKKKEPKVLTPEQQRRKARLNAKGSPFRGVRGRYHRIIEMAELIFFFPGWRNSRAAREIVETGRGTIYGYGDIVYLYPMIPITILFTLISFMTGHPISMQIMGLIWGMVLVLSLFTMGEDVSGKMVGAVVGVIVGLTAIWIVLQVTDTVNVNKGIWKFVSFFQPMYARGLCSFVAVGIALLLAYSITKSKLHEELNVRGNRWSPSRLQTEASFDSVNHRVYARTPDWVERIIYRCRDLVIVPILEVTNLHQPGELEEKAVHTLENVPAGRRVFDAIEFAASEMNTEIKPA